MENNQPVYVEGVLFREIQTKFGPAFVLTFKQEFLDFLMRKIYSNPNGVSATFFKKKTPTKYTTHYGKLNEINHYTTGVIETFSKDSQDNTDKVDPEIDIDADVPF